MLGVVLGDPERGKTFWTMGEASQMTPALAVVGDPENYPEWQVMSVAQYRDGGQFDLPRVILDDGPKQVAELLDEIAEHKVRELRSLVLDEFDVLLRVAPDSMENVARRHRHLYTVPGDGWSFVMAQRFIALETYVSCATILRVHQLSSRNCIGRAAFYFDRMQQRVTEGPGKFPEEWAERPTEEILMDARLCHGALQYEKKTGRIYFDSCPCDGAMTA